MSARTPPTYLPVNKAKVQPGDHVVMNPALREWLASKQQEERPNA